VPDDGGKSANEALDKWLREKDELLAGRIPRGPQPEGITLRNLANAFLRHKKSLLEPFLLAGGMTTMDRTNGRRR
jgi:hypothetical protein